VKVFSAKVLSVPLVILNFLYLFLDVYVGLPGSPLALGKLFKKNSPP
jgi:hypothetical protein